MALNRSTLLANSVKPECLCVRDCDAADCTMRGRWHNHVDEVCAVHPDTLVD